MTYQHIFDPLASKEYEEAFIWYEERSHVAADNFLLAVENAISLVCSSPYRYRNTYKNLREITIKRYPFNLIYLVDEDKKIITFVSVFHHSRDPRRKYKKRKAR